MPPRLLIAVILILGLPLLSRAADAWPQFRGPSGQGTSTATNLPVTWSKTGNVQWAVSLPGAGWSSPVVLEGRLFLTAGVQDGNRLSLQALCYDAQSGRQLWVRELFSSERAGNIHSKNTHASPTPFLETNRVYAHFGNEGTAALDFSGNILWTNRSIHYSPVHGGGGSPVVWDGALFFSAEGASDPAIYALHKETGLVKWRTPREAPAKRKFSFSTPLIIQTGGITQLISAGSGMVGGFDPQTGHEIWRVHYGEGYSVVPRPVFGKGLIFLGTGFDRPSVYAIKPDGMGDATETHVAWKLQRGAPNTPSPLLVGDELYLLADSGIASCVDAKTGTVHWQERIGGNASASPIHADGRIYMQNEEGVTTVLAAEKTFRVLAKNDLGERTLASPAAVDNALFIRTAGRLYRLSASKGE